MADCKNVLILSNDGLLRDLLGQLLSHERMASDDAESVEAAGAVCRENAPGVILMDAVEDPSLATGGLLRWVLADYS